MRAASVLIFCLLSASALAAELSATQSGTDLGIRIDGLDYPPNLARELESGLTNRLYLRARVLDGASSLQVATAEIAIRYDLWDQNFTVTRTVAGAGTDEEIIPDAARLRAWLASLRLPELFDARTLPPNRSLAVRAELLLNPIGREKLRMIRKWVAENSAPVEADQGISASNTVFNRIFEQYADGSDLAAEWRVELISPPFRRAE